MLLISSVQGDLLQKMTDKLPKLKNTSWIILLIIVFFLSLSMFFFIKDFSGVRRTFVFHSTEGGNLKIENRFEPVFPAQGKVRNYIDELLLGPISEHCKPVFEKGTKVDYMILEGSKLTVNLSKELLTADAFSTDFKSQIELFKLNIKKNFHGIKNIEIYIDKKIPFESISEKNLTDSNS